MAKALRSFTEGPEIGDGIFATTSDGKKILLSRVPEPERSQRAKNHAVLLAEIKRRGGVEVQGGRTVFKDTGERIY